MANERPPSKEEIDALRQKIDKVSTLLKETLDPYIQRYDLLNTHELTQPLKEARIPRQKVVVIGGGVDSKSERIIENESFMRLYFKSIECVLTRKCSNDLFIDAKATDLTTSLEMYESIRTLHGVNDLHGSDDLTKVLSSLAPLAKTWIEGKVNDTNQSQPITDSPLNSLRDEYLYYRKRSDGPLKRMLSFLMICSGCDILIESQNTVHDWKAMKDKATTHMSEQEEEKKDDDVRAFFQETVSFSDDLVEDAVKERDLEIEKIENARAEPYANIYPANIPPPPPFNAGLFSGLFQASGSIPPQPEGKSSGQVSGPPGQASIASITQSLGPSLTVSQSVTQGLTQGVKSSQRGTKRTQPVSKSEALGLEDQTRIQVYSIKSHPINLAREADSLLRTLSQTKFSEKIKDTVVFRYVDQHEVFHRYFTLNASDKSYVKYKEGMLVLVDKLLLILQKREKNQHLRVVEQDLLPKIKDILYSIFLSLGITLGIVQEKEPEYETYSFPIIGELKSDILMEYKKELDTNMRGVLPRILKYIATSGNEKSLDPTVSVSKVEPVPIDESKMAESKMAGPKVAGQNVRQKRLNRSLGSENKGNPKNRSQRSLGREGARGKGAVNTGKSRGKGASSQAGISRPNEARQLSLNRPPS